MRVKQLIYLFLLMSISLHAQHREWIIHFDEPLSPTNKTHERTDLHFELLSHHLNIYKLVVKDSMDENQIRELLGHQFKDLVISPNLPLEKRFNRPDDEKYTEQWSLDIIQAEGVWNASTGGQLENGEELVIAIMDDGFQLNHPDLKNNIWSNPNEIPGDGLDNDGNGYIDDHRGINIQSLNDVHNVDSHGTRVAGIIGAEGNNTIGIAGINWNTKLLILSNVTNVGEIIKGYEYIYDLKKRYLDSNGTDGANILVSNFSAGIRRHFPSEFPGWCLQYELLGSVGILSVAATPNEDYDIDLEGDMPSLCSSDYLIMATNTNRNDLKVVSAAVSETSVDLGAPGENILSTDTNNTYDLINGTSASSPHVSGAVGLLYSVACNELIAQMKNNPSEVALIIKQAILDGVDEIAGLTRTVSGGRLNIFNSMLALGEVCGPTETDELELRSVGTESNGSQSINMLIEYSTDVFSSHNLYIYDMLGRLVYATSFNPNIFLEKTIRINNINLSPGIYIVSLTDSSRISSKKIIIVN